MEAVAYAARRERLRRRMRERGLAGLIVQHAADRYYLSGFELHDPQPNESAGCLLLTLQGEDWLCTDARYLDAARRLWDEDRIVLYGGDAGSRIRQLLRDAVSGNVGVDTRITSVDLFGRLSAGAGPALVAANGIVDSLRVIKDAGEIAALERSCALNQRLMDWLPSRIVPGKTERELAWEIEKYFREQGAEELAFASIVAAGPDAALPHCIPADVAVTDNCPVLVDVGGRLEGYCSDQTRTFWAGDRPSPEFSRTLELVRAAQEAALKCIRPGVRGCEVYAAAHRVFEQAGVEKFFTHSLGHGVGLETHEAPRLGPGSQTVLEAGMVVTVEPGLYYPEWGGVRWEYTTLVTEDGVRPLL